MGKIGSAGAGEGVGDACTRPGIVNVVIGIALTIVGLESIY